MRDDGRRRGFVVLLDDRRHAVRGEDFERRALRGTGERVRILAEDQRSVDSAPGPILANRLHDRQDVRFVEGRIERRSPMAARAERDALRGIVDVRPQVVIRGEKLRYVDEQFGRRGLPGQGRNGHNVASAASSAAVFSGAYDPLARHSTLPSGLTSNTVISSSLAMAKAALNAGLSM